MGMLSYTSGLSNILKLLLIAGCIYAILVGANQLQPASASSLAAPQALAEVAGVQYLLDTSDPTRLSGVVFRLVGDTARLQPNLTVEVQLAEPGPLYACEPAGEAWRCALNGVSVSSVTVLRAVIKP